MDDFERRHYFQAIENGYFHGPLTKKVCFANEFDTLQGTTISHLQNRKIID